MKRTYDIVIIGSGAGGGTVAQELSSPCRQGARIAVLEKGPKLRPEEFTGRELEMVQALYEDGGGFLTAERTMTLAFGCTYGGSTAVYTGTSLLPPERILRRWNVPDLTFSDVEQRAPTHYHYSVSLDGEHSVKWPVVSSFLKRVADEWVIPVGEAANLSLKRNLGACAKEGQEPVKIHFNLLPPVLPIVQIVVRRPYSSF
jgi:choline dehydrogenase-like flavoprotein